MKYQTYLPDATTKKITRANFIDIFSIVLNVEKIMVSDQCCGNHFIE